MILVKPIKQTIYWDIESEFLYDYLFFASNLRFWQGTENTYNKHEKKYKVKGLCFMNLFKTYAMALEDLGVICLALKRRFDNDIKCLYQKNFKTKKTPVIFTIVNYGPGDAKIRNIIGDTKRDIEKNLGLNIVNHINITLMYPKFNYIHWKDNFMSCINGLADDQIKKGDIFNKIKHGGVVLSDGRIFKPKQPAGPAVIYVNKEENGDIEPLVLKSVKYKDSEFKAMKKNLISINRMIKELLAIYLIRYYPDFLKKNKKLSSALKLLKKIEFYYD